ncbi:TPA: hypothetical protein N2F16_005310 [Salmonella enterica]|nr:hypothetical protein [Salmonella enterica]HCL4892254.1 hypothetical protein [Salmonella enterica]
MQTSARKLTRDKQINIRATDEGSRLENGIYGHSRFCNTDFDDKLACLNLSGV